MTLPDVVPLFPLPNVVHFPGVPLPLHVFEPRYRDMVRDALEGSRLIGMVLLRAGWEQRYDGRPPVFDVGTAGEIVRADPLEDGRWNIVLRGVREFTIESEADDRSYRTARVRWRDEPGAPLREGEFARVWELTRAYLALRERPVTLPAEPDQGAEPAFVVNFLAQHLDLPPLERQALLETPDPPARAVRLAAALQLQIEALRRGGGGPQTVH